jgi:protein disulfide-isomerase
MDILRAPLPPQRLAARLLSRLNATLLPASWRAALGAPGVLALALLGMPTAQAGEGNTPYDEHADGASLVAQAREAAQATHRQVLVVFGANWCPDCRALDTALRAPEAEELRSHWVVAKLDVGSFDRNLSLARELGVPLRKGIPAAVVLGPDGQAAFATQGGELANAGSMGTHAILDYLARHTGAASGLNVPAEAIAGH